MMTDTSFELIKQMLNTQTDIKLKQKNIIWKEDKANFTARLAGVTGSTSV